MKLALIGLGNWGKNLLRVFHDLGVLTAAFDSNDDTIDFFSKDKKYSDVKFLNISKINYSDFDSIAIATPPKTHYKYAMDAIKNNCHVFVEKPMTLSPIDSDRLCKESKLRNLIFFVGHIALYSPEVRMIKKIISSGDLGDVLYISANRCNFGRCIEPNVVYDLAPHDFSVCNYLLDSIPKRIQMCGNGFVNKSSIEVASINIDYGNNKYCTLNLSWMHPKKIRNISIYGVNKMLYYDDTVEEDCIKIYNKSITRSDNVNNIETSYFNYLLNYNNNGYTSPNFGRWEPLREECKTFVFNVKYNIQPITDVEHGHLIVKMLDCSYISYISNSCWIDL